MSTLIHPLLFSDWRQKVEHLYFISVDDDLVELDEVTDISYLFRAYRLFIVFENSQYPLELDVVASNVGHVLVKHDAGDSWEQILKWADRVDEYAGRTISEVQTIVHPEAQLYEDGSEKGVLSILMTFYDGAQLQIIAANVCDHTLVLGGEELFAFDHERYSLLDIHKTYPEAYLLK